MGCDTLPRRRHAASINPVDRLDHFAANRFALARCQLGIKAPPTIRLSEAEGHDVRATICIDRKLGEFRVNLPQFLERRYPTCKF